MKKIYLDLGITAYHFFQERMRENIGFNAYEFREKDLTEFLNNFCSYMRSKNYEVYIKTDKSKSHDVSCKEIAERIISLYTETDESVATSENGSKDVEYYYYLSKDAIDTLSEKYAKIDKDYFSVICDYEADRTRKNYESKVNNKYFKELYEVNFLDRKAEDDEEENEEEFENEKFALA